MKNPKTLYISDLDGTLLNGIPALSDETLSIVNRLVENGLLFTYATARSLVTAAKVTSGLCLCVPVIVYNGTFLMDSTTGQRIVSNGFTDSEAAFIRDILTENDIQPVVYSFINGIEKFSFLDEKENDGLQYFLASRTDDVRRREVTDLQSLYEGDCFYFSCIGHPERLALVKALFETDARFHCIDSTDIYSSAPWFEILPTNADKAKAALALKERLGCEKLVVFGDGENDISLFEAADEGYAMENAVPALKAKATAVIGSNTADAVAHWLEEHTKFD